jgi:hypothetical protein
MKPKNIKPSDLERGNDAFLDYRACSVTNDIIGHTGTITCYYIGH